jgi:hypothetical protein
MSITLSIYDLFAYAIPGSLYLALLTYVGDRLGWVSLQGVSSLNTTILLIVGTLASYLLGHLAYQLGRAVERVLPGSGRTISDGRRAFLAHASEPQAEQVVESDPYFLFTAMLVRAKEAALEVSRFRAGALMLRNSVPALLSALVISVIEVVGGENRLMAGCCAALFLAGAVSALRHSREQAAWAVQATYQTIYWMEEEDSKMEKADGPPVGKRKWSGARLVDWLR